jgi:antitoxin component YwqK of YwqJK toxin-antitoxin module
VYKGPEELDSTFVFPYEIMLYEDLTPYPRFEALNSQNNSIKENGYFYPYMDSLPDGNWFLYFKTDSTNAICMFKKTIKNFFIDGELIYFFENGATLRKDKYVNGLISDTSYWSFEKDSSIYFLNLFETRDGISTIAQNIEYNKDKNGLKFISSFYDSKSECRLLFYESNQIKVYYKIQNNKKNGKAYYFDENGILLKTEMYKNGVLQNKK